MAKGRLRLSWADAITGLTVSALVLLVFLLHWADGLEYKLYDMRSRLHARNGASDNVIIVAIDDESIRQIGRWPWPRSYMADAIQQLSEAGAKVVGVDVFFSDKEINPGLEEIRRLAQQPQAEPLKPLLEASAKRLDNDARLEEEMAFAQNCVLPMYFQLGSSVGDNPRPVAPEIERNFLRRSRAAGGENEGVEIVAPYAPFAKQAKAIGQANLTPSPDGVQRSAPLVIAYNNRLFPAFSLQVLSAYYGLGAEDYGYAPGRELTLGRAHIPVDEHGALLVNYVGGASSRAQTFPVVSFRKLRDKQIPNMEIFRDKIVLIGVAATGGGDLQVTPVGDLFPGVEIHANIIDNVLSGRYLTRPAWATRAELAAMLSLALFVSLAIPLLSAGRSALLSAMLLIVIVGGGVYAFAAMGWWIKILYPSLQLVVGYTAVVSRRYFAAERRKVALEGESVETNRMLGLSFQGQGMLDMAFEKFRKLPLNDSSRECLYNLALDFERKRQFNKAASALEHLTSDGVDYKDARARADKLKAAGETVIFGRGGGLKGGESTVMIERGPGDLARPTLGRYEVLRELGKGAMGVVYLGRDPKINRDVAIKTLRFQDEFEAEDMASMKERFFREAESAGRLVHPNIVTIYDAGDDGDISYIAMELLVGHDLKEHIAPGRLLEPGRVLELMAVTADALDYAHSQNVVHRDIKPANIMLLDDGQVKVTDFGIARITSQSKTATGAVMGTPSYMSPEQLSGQRVDGRADLFSLGVTAYELLTGVKPFTGESVATLMYRIANAPHPRLGSVREGLPPAIESVLDRALAKRPEDRYQRGAEMARALREALQG